ncbi:hypothetical protein RvY_07010-2 [Ramazzottius varieornatus]|uniref:Fucosyltransferase n=1 Tax=Ramazzottius varieornatus TaxID=947166 RepID=A0A1D1V0L6_RAMVA|nr:hypothetical protein RvY_07010-2 [Ramazzottius varieornatus]
MIGRSQRRLMRFYSKTTRHLKSIMAQLALRTKYGSCRFWSHRTTLRSSLACMAVSTGLRRKVFFIIIKRSTSLLNVNDFASGCSYRLDSELVTPYGKWVVYDPKVLAKPQALDYGGRKAGKKKVAWFVSNCQTANKRLEYARELAEYIEVDIYGSCGSLKCPKKGKCGGKLLREEYKFYLSFENSNCKDYITEKLWFALENDALPVVMGPLRTDYEFVAPHKSFIHVQDFASPKDLADYLLRLDANDTEYNQYFQWKGTGEMIDTKLHCRLCALLHADNMKHKVYHDLQGWWGASQVCSHSRSPPRLPVGKDDIK